MFEVFDSNSATILSQLHRFTVGDTVDRDVHMLAQVSSKMALDIVIKKIELQMAQLLMM